MAQLSTADFYAKWVPLLADNVFQDIDGARFDQLLQDMRDSFASSLLAKAPNVPTYDAATVYGEGFVVRYSQAGGRESFYYSLQAGLLPHPTYNQTDAYWKLVPGPVAELALYQYLTLDEAQSIDGDSVVPGRRHGVVGKWNASASDQLVFLDGLENYFRRRGTLLRADGSQQEVDVDVAAGSYTLVAAGTTYTAGPGINISPAGEITTTGNSSATYQLTGAKRQQVAYANQLLLAEPDEQFLGKQFYDEVTLPGSVYWFRCAPFTLATGSTELRWVRQLIS